MFVILCEEPLRSGTVDEFFASEADALTVLGQPYGLLDFDALVNHEDGAQAIRKACPVNQHGVAVYRGWMLSPDHYAILYSALAKRDLELVNSPDAYRLCHWFPESYRFIEPYTARSTWLAQAEAESMDRVQEAARAFGDTPLVVKDYVKSQKHYWHEACYIPSAADEEGVARVVAAFLDLQGPDLNGGLVLREYVELEPLTLHSKSGMPLSVEFRLFWVDDELLSCSAYWDEGDYAGEGPPEGVFRDVAQAIPSRFFTMDIAKRADGEWMIVELGDGQVAGLPEAIDVRAFYHGLREHFTEA